MFGQREEQRLRNSQEQHASMFRKQKEATCVERSEGAESDRRRGQRGRGGDEIT